MRKQTIEVFSDFIYGTDAVYSPTELSDPLGRWDQLAVQIIADQSGGTSPTLTAKLEESNDGRNWSERSGGLAAETLNAGQTDIFSFADSGTTPAMAYVRLALSMGGTSPEANVKAYICGRDDG